MSGNVYENPLISIIVPSFNQGKYIEKTILSVLHQSYQNWELLIQDACSKDETGEICKRYQQLDSRIRFFQEKDKGFADAVNKALAKITGSIGAIQSSDDYYAHQEVFSEVVRHYHEHPELQLLTSGSRMVDSDYRFLETPEISRDSGFIDPVDAFLLKDHFAQGSTFFKIARIQEIGGLHADVDMVADTDLWVRLANWNPVTSQALLRVEGIWSHLIMHPEQRTADQSRFHLGRSKMYIRYFREQQMNVPHDIKSIAVTGHLIDTFHYLLFKKKSTEPAENLFQEHFGYGIPLRWKIKKMLCRISWLHSFYFRNFKDYDSGAILGNARGANSLWFEIPTLKSPYVKSNL